jgi:LPS export ABC transporter protein LptC
VRAARRLRFKVRAGRVLLALLVLSAVAGTFWYRRIAVDVEPQAPADTAGNSSKAEMVTRDFRHVETRMDHTVWILEAAQAEVLDEYGKMRAVKVTWYGESGTLPVIITSANGEVDFRRRKATLYGAVRVERSDGAVLLTDQLVWDEESKRLSAKSLVVITTSSFTFQGDRFEGNLDTEHFVLGGNVRGDVRVGAATPSRPS